MGYLSGVIDAYTNLPIKKFSAVQANTDHHLERRSGTYTVIGADGGIDPYGFNAQPAAIRNVTYQFREYFKPTNIVDDIHHRDADAARDALMYAVGSGMPVNLEYTTSSGSKRYALAKASDFPHTFQVDSDKFVDFKVTFELMVPFWSDEFPGNISRWGAFVWGSGTIWGGTPIALSSASVNISVDLTGATAFDVPKMTIDGPYGGSGGFIITNNSLQVRTPSGLQPVSISYNIPLLTGQQLTIDAPAVDAYLTTSALGMVDAFASLTWPQYQRYMFVVDPHTKDLNPINSITVACVGSSPTTGGDILLIYTKRYW